MNDFTDKKVLVVGGEGFIGQHLVSKLNDLKAYVVSLGTRSEVNSKADEYLSVDIRNKEKLSYALKTHDFDFVFNLCGYINHSAYTEGGRDVIDTHFVGLLNLIEEVFTPKLKGFVQIGSSDEYGSATSPQKESVREAAISPYSVAKVAGTHLVQALARTESFPGVIIRPFLTYGPGQDLNRFIPQVITGCIKDKTFPTSEGKQLRDFCYVNDVVEGMLLAAKTQSAIGEVINVASGHPVTVKNIIETIVEIIGKGEPVWGAVSYRQGENMELYADINKANKILNWSPKTSLNDGLSKTIKYYENIEGKK